MRSITWVDSEWIASWTPRAFVPAFRQVFEKAEGLLGTRSFEQLPNEFSNALEADDDVI